MKGIKREVIRTASTTRETVRYSWDRNGPPPDPVAMFNEFAAKARDGATPVELVVTFETRETDTGLTMELARQSNRRRRR
jgi:hypothetical protein